MSSLVGALPAETLAAFDEPEGNEQARMLVIYSNPLAALWLGVGLRAPMMRAQLPWIADQLKHHGIGPGSRVLDVGSGCGLTAAVVQSLLGCEVVGIDPQPGSAAAGAWISEGLGSSVEFFEMFPRDLPAAGLGRFDAVIAQTAVTYTQPNPCQDARGGRGVFLAALQDPTPVTEDLRAMLDVAVEAGLLLACDHDQPSLWGYFAIQAGEHDLVPEWTSAAANAFQLPLGEDRQISLAFVPGTLGPDDLDRLSEIIGS